MAKKRKKATKKRKKATKKKKTAKKKKAAKKKAAKKKKPAKRKVKKTKKKAKKKSTKRKKKPTKRKKATKKKAKKGKRGKRYSAKRQATLLSKYHELRKGGMSAQKAAKKVGVSYLTLLKWEKKSGKRIKTKRGRPAGKKTKRGMTKKAALKKALKVPKRRGRPKKTKQVGLTLVTPSGFRIEGITSAELIKVLRGLK